MTNVDCEQISSLQLLTEIERCGPHWPGALADHSIVIVREAVDREVMAGNLADGATLSARGRQELRRLRSAP